MDWGREAGGRQEEWKLRRSCREVRTSECRICLRFNNRGEVIPERRRKSAKVSASFCHLDSNLEPITSWLNEPKKKLERGEHTSNSTSPPAAASRHDVQQPYTTISAHRRHRHIHTSSHRKAGTGQFRGNPSHWKRPWYC
jgi:hypothetical protein